LRAKLLILSLLFFVGCAQERALKSAVPDELRVPKSIFSGDFYFLKSIVEVTSPGATHAWIPPGMYLDSDHIVRFEIQPKTLEVRSIHSKIQTGQPAPESNVLARLPIRTVDVLRKQNVDGEDTHEEEVTEERNPWNKRSFIEFDSGASEFDPVALFAKDTKSVTPPEKIEHDPETGSILFDVVRLLNDDTQIRVRYSFLPVPAASDYEPRAYPVELEAKVGFFKSQPEEFDRYGRVTLTARSEAQKLNRWDPRRTVTYHLGPDFPEHLQPEAFRAVKAWNEPLEKLLGHPLLVLEKNSGQRIGDLRYNLFHYDTSLYSVHGVLGYGPTVVHPITGEIRKGDVVLYGGTIRRALFNERLWAAELGDVVRGALPQTDLRRTQKPWGSYPRPVAVTELPSQWGTPRPEALLAEFLSFNHPAQWTSRLRQQVTQGRLTHTTTLSSEFLSGIHGLYQQFEASDGEVEKAIVSALASHELGHELGLRHNLKASADRAHFKHGHLTSSVMDYAFLVTQEPSGPGPYDVAALKVAYTSDARHEADLKAGNYYFCTDEGLYSSMDPLCSQYDRGTTLRSLVRSHFERYYAAYAFNNLRLDRAHFLLDDKTYLSRVISFLLPLRQIHDHADAIIRAEEKKLYADLWYLLRERIQADRDTKERATVQVSEGERLEMINGALFHDYQKTTREIDLEKVSIVAEDARRAKEMAFRALMEIILSTSRPNYEQNDEVFGRAQVRGVLDDKLLSLILVGAQTSDPLGRGETVTLFKTLGPNGMAELLTSLISNVVPAEKEDPSQVESSIADFDVNLREMALLLITKQLAIPGGAGESLDLLRLERVNIDNNIVKAWSSVNGEEREAIEKTADPDTLSVLRDLTLRDPMRLSYQELMKSLHAQDEYEAENAKNRIRQGELNRSKSNVALAHLYNGQYLRAKVKDARIRYPSAAGLLIRDNLNRLEDRWLAALVLARESQDESAAKTYFDTASKIHEAYTNEKIFAERLFKTYEYQIR